MKIYQYKIKEVDRVIDGDTVDVFIDLGFDIIVKKRIRLYGINTPEIRTRNKKEKELGYKAKNAISHLLYSSEELYLDSIGIGKYGRVLGIIRNEHCDINDYLVEKGYAERV